MAERAHRLDVLLVNLLGIRKCGYRGVDARLPQQMKQGIRRTVRVVLNVVRLRAGELVPRMEAGDLDLPDEIELLERVVRDLQEIVVIQEIRKHPGMDQQRGLDLA